MMKRSKATGAMKTMLRAVTLLALAATSTIASAGTPPKRALFVVTSHKDLGATGLKTGYYASEVAHPYAVLTKAGFSVDFASPKGGKAPLDERSRSSADAETKAFLSDPKLMERLDRTIPVSAVQPRRYGVIFFAGGHGTMWDFRGNKLLQRLIAGIHERGGIIAAVCHGPAALVDVKLPGGRYLVAGKSIAAFTNEEEEAAGLTRVVPFSLEDELRRRGARFTKAEPWKNHAVRHGKIITGQNPASAKAVAEEILAALGLEKPVSRGTF